MADTGLNGNKKTKKKIKKAKETLVVRHLE